MKTQQRGFTIIELMVATLAFSIVLLIASNAVVQIGKMYYKAMIESKTQETTRNISEEITRSFQFSNGFKAPGLTDAANNKYQFCIGDTRYTYQLNKQVKGAVYGLRAERKDFTSACAAGGANGKELLAENMRLLRFDVETLDPAAKTYSIDIKIAYGDNDLLDYYPPNADDTTAPSSADPASWANGHCRSGISGSQFCAVAQLDNVVRKRLN